MAALAGVAALVAWAPSCQESKPDAPAACLYDLDCSTNDPNCMIDSCDTAKNVCVHIATGNAGCMCDGAFDCNDGILCTTDSCQSGACVHSPKDPCPCELDSECDDTDACTDDTCVDATCLFEPISGCSSATTSGSSSSASTGTAGGPCNGNGTCEMPDEDCACADCAGEKVCGAGCTAFTLDAVTCGNGFCEGGVSSVGGAGADVLQGFQLTKVGVFQLVLPANLSDCSGDSPCLGMAVDDYTKWLAATSGVLDVTSLDPVVATVKDLVLEERTVDMMNNITLTPGGLCAYAASGSLPSTP